MRLKWVTGQVVEALVGCTNDRQSDDLPAGLNSGFRLQRVNISNSRARIIRPRKSDGVKIHSLCCRAVYLLLRWRSINKPPSGSGGDNSSVSLLPIDPICALSNLKIKQRPMDSLSAAP
jgi:hypothetical protein